MAHSFFIPSFTSTTSNVSTSAILKSPHHPPRITPIHTTTRVSFSSSTSLTTPAWRMILFTDGHIHNLLSHLTSHQLPLSLLHTDPLAAPPHPPPYLPPDEALPNVPCIRRTITLNGPDGTPLLHASSVWTRHIYDSVMRPHEGKSLYEAFRHVRLDVSRAVLAVHYGTCDELCPLFAVDQGTRMWARDYVFRRRGVPFLLVHELLSPRLQNYLGDIVPPLELTDTPAKSTNFVTELYKKKS